MNAMIMLFHSARRIHCELVWEGEMGVGGREGFGVHKNTEKGFGSPLQRMRFFDSRVVQVRGFKPLLPIPRCFGRRPEARLSLFGVADVDFLATPDGVRGGKHVHSAD